MRLKPTRPDKNKPVTEVFYDKLGRQIVVKYKPHIK